LSADFMANLNNAIFVLPFFFFFQPRQASWQKK